MESRDGSLIRGANREPSRFVCVLSALCSKHDDNRDPTPLPLPLKGLLFIHFGSYFVELKYLKQDATQEEVEVQ